MIRKMGVLIVIAVGFALGSGQAKAESLYYLVNTPNAKIVSGDKVFDNFTNVIQTGSVTPLDLNTINVSPVVYGSEEGIRFSVAGGWSLVGSNLSYDLGFNFRVTQLDGQPIIDDNTLSMVGGVSLGGTVDLGETVTDLQLNTLATKYVYYHPASSKTSDHEIFTHAVSVAYISKDLSLATGPNENSSAFVSHFDQTFSQIPPPPVPTPSTLASSLSLLAAFGGFMRIRRR